MYMYAHNAAKCTLILNTLIILQINDDVQKTFSGTYIIGQCLLSMRGEVT